MGEVAEQSVDSVSARSAKHVVGKAGKGARHERCATGFGLGADRDGDQQAGKENSKRLSGAFCNI